MNPSMRVPTLLALTLFAAACSSTSLPSRPPSIVGVVQAVEPRILVVEQATNPDAMLYTTDAHTRVVVRAPDGSRQRGTMADIVIGVTVRAWTKGVVLDSYPGQGYAEAFEIP
jgi:hypothetical protein